MSAKNIVLNPVKSIAKAVSGTITTGNSSSGSGGGQGSDANKNLIPGDTRQKMLPFVISPGVSPQIFSFRQKDVAWWGDGLINIIPSDQEQFDQDLGIKLLVSKYLEKDNKGLSNKEMIFNNLPALQIREYTQDTKLDLLWNLLKYGIQGAKDSAGGEAEKDGNDFTQTKKLSKNQLTIYANKVANKMKDSEWWKKLFESLSSWFNTSCFGINDLYNTETRTTLVLYAVYCLYYRMIGSTTTNRYVLPYDGQEMFNTNGQDGWPGPNQHGYDGTSSFGIFGKLLNWGLGGNVKVVTEPIWSGTFGGNVGSIKVKMSLFNDTYESAMNNFLFVNTIFPQNMFLQYGIWQQPPSVYDIKIEGGRRWFMCSGSFSCNYKGVMRNVTEEFVKQLIGKHGNSCIKLKQPEFFIERKLIKIPDVYEIDLNFTSLLPDNFNQYLFQYAANNNIDTDKTVRQEPWYQDDSGPAFKYINDLISTSAKEAETEAPETNTQEGAAQKGQKSS